MEVNSFWHGGRLTTLERLCVTSFLQNGIGYNLYVYDEPAGLPENVTLREAEQIVPRARLFRYSAGTFNVGSFAGFSNLFRYSLIYSSGGWWVDTDLCCVNVFPPHGEEAYLQAPTRRKELRVASGFFRAPAGSEVMRHCLHRFGEKEVNKIVHGETGPELLTEAVVKCGKGESVLENELYFPVPWWDYGILFSDEEIAVEHCFTVHFWNAKITADKLDMDAQYPKNCVFERLKRKYL